MNRNILSIILLTLSSLTFAQKNFIDQPFVETTAKADTLVIPDKIYIAINLNESDSKNKKSVEEQEKLLETTLKKLNILSYPNNFYIFKPLKQEIWKYLVVKI